MFGCIYNLVNIKFHSIKNLCVVMNSCCINTSRVSFRNAQFIFFKSYSSARIKNDKFDIAVVGGGIIGTATALELKKRLPCYSICLIEKESTIAAHQSTRNSGVIHSGIYYTPGSMKAKMCVEGMHLLYKYCEANGIPCKRNGKLIIAINKKETKWLNDLFQRGNQNDVPGLEILDPHEFREIEPYMVGLKALYSPYTGIVDYGEVTRHFATQFRTLGGTIIFNFKVSGFIDSTEGEGSTACAVTGYPVTILCDDGRKIKAGFVLTCGGLYADTLAQMTGESPEPRILPFRGVYYLLNPEKNCMVHGNVYPVPDPDMPFIGVHFTPKIDGSVWLGPTAMLAYKREGYSWNEFDMGELYEIVAYRGMQRFVMRHFKDCIYEVVRSVSKQVLWKEAQLYMPTIKLKDLLPGVLSGVQAQAMNPDGTFVHDFSFSSEGKGKILHVRNAPSPAATSALAIANFLATKVQKLL